MSQIEKHKAFRVTTPKLTNYIVDFYRHESGAFAYGNRSMVTIEINEQYHSSIDTRYDPVVMRNFKKWCEDCLRNLYIDGTVWEEMV